MSTAALPELPLVCECTRRRTGTAMTALSAQILEAASRRPEGSKEFLALGKRDPVDQALRRLVNRGQLVKITRQTGGDPAPGTPLAVPAG